jgi:TRAP-type C4-dicarboxylate transport system permease small subunit
LATGADLQELLILVAVVAVLMAATAAIFKPLRFIARYAELAMLAGSIAVILLVMLFVCAEVMMRYVFNSPIEGHLEGSELLLPMIVFLAISYTQRTHGHVGMDLVLDMMAPRLRKATTMLSLLVSVLISAILCWFCIKHAHQLWLYDDVTMSPPYFKTWPASASIALGYGMIAIRMTLQFYSLLDPERFPDDTPTDDHALHQSSD